MKTLSLIAAVALAALPGCSAEPEHIASNSSAYMFAMEPCMTTGSSYVAPWVNVGPTDANHTVVKVIASYDTQESNRAYTLTARQLVWPNFTEDGSSACWDRFPSQVPETWVTGPYNPPGATGYYVGAFQQARQVTLFGNGGVTYNAPYNPSPWVVYKAQIWSGSAWVEHSWTLNATDVYHWVQNY